MTSLRQYLDNTLQTKKFELPNGNVLFYQPLRPAVICADGTELSVQHSHSHYCEPRQDGAWRYSKVEVMCTVEVPESWLEYQESHDGRIFAWIPVEMVQAFIDSHGGIANES